jgi:hypothetical protein
MKYIILIGLLSFAVAIFSSQSSKPERPTDLHFRLHQSETAHLERILSKRFKEPWTPKLSLEQRAVYYSRERQNSFLTPEQLKKSIDRLSCPKNFR